MRIMSKFISSISVFMIGMLFIFFSGIGLTSCVSCNGNEDSTDSTATEIVQPLSISAMEVSPGGVVSESSKDTEEKLKVSVTPINFLTITHENTCFDFHANITMDVYKQDSTIVLNEHGKYGQEGVYRYFTIKSIVGPIYKGKYNLVVQRNGNQRSNFRIEVK